ncbi:Ig-like domain-containing protein [Psychroserpens sp. MEBiC05023]
MMKKLLFASLFTVLLSSGLHAQVTIFSEDFEAATGAQNIAGPYLGWQNGQFNTTPPTNNNYFWIFNQNRAPVINGQYSMAVSRNNPVDNGPGTIPRYRTTRTAATFVYHTTPIDATNYSNLTLDFNWICEGESLLGFYFDYGTVMYSLDANTWTILPDLYAGQNTTQSVTNLDLSFLDGQTFYLGFGWNNDGFSGGFPGLIIDDIDVQGILLSPCVAPTQQPTALNLTPTGDTINGSFTAAVPAADNYLVVRSPLASPPAPGPQDGTAYNIGDAIGAGTVVDIDDNTSFTATGLTPNTQYYFYIYSFNDNGCIGGPIYNNSNPLTGNTTTTNSTYCTPSTSNSTTALYIDDVEFIGNLVNDVNLGNGTSSTSPGYSDYTSRPNSVQAQGEGVNIYVGSITGRGAWKAWVDWNKDGDFTDAGEEVYNTNGIATSTTTFGFVIPAAQAIGDYRIRIRFYNSFGYYNGPGFACDGVYEIASDPLNHFDSCTTFTGFTASIDPGCGSRNVNFFEYGEAEDYTFTVVESCAATIASITDGVTCGPGPVTLQVTGNASATSFNLYDAETGGNLVASNSTGTFTPNITSTTEYWVTASDGNCESLKRLKIVGTMNPITNLTINAATSVCGVDDIVEITASGDTETAYLIDEDFEGGGLGTFSNISLADNTAPATANWQNESSTYVPGLPDYLIWFPAMSSGFGTNNFAVCNSDVGQSPTFPYPAYITSNALTSAVVNSTDYTDLSLDFDMYYSHYLADGIGAAIDYVSIEISTDGGATWPVANEINRYTGDVGYGTEFEDESYDLSAYINQTQLRIRIRFYGEWVDGVAVDNIQLYGSRPLSPSFTWSVGVDAYTDPSAVTPFEYVPGTTASSVYIRPTLTQLEQDDFTFTAFATLSNGCIVNRPITITNNTKIWDGSQGTSTWNDPDNWSPRGIPTADNCVIIRDVGALPDPQLLGPPIPPTPAYARNLSVLSNGNLELQPSTSLTVTDWINVDPAGTFNVRSSANLVQVTNVATNNNTGNINMQREVTGVGNYDYVYWSSAVENFGVSSVSPGSNAALILEWLPTVGGNGTGNYGEWQATAENMIPGKGYAIRELTGTATANTAEFIGRPSNGIINRAITRGTYNGADYAGPGSTLATAIDDNWNLVGNPFPSAIYADTFITTNAANITDDTDPTIAGTVYLWRHQSIPSNAVTDPFYGDYVYNYNPNDYVAYNLTGSTPAGFNGYIGAGQGFFVLMDHGATNPSNLIFDNTMRSGVYANDQFYRTDGSSNDENEETTIVEKNRIWLDLIDSNNSAYSILVGYITGATYEKDRLYDGNQLAGTSTLFYSLIEDEKMAIQGRSLPFDEADLVPLGFETPQSGTYTIGINNLDGIFASSEINIYLEDTFTNTIHDLRLSPYSFSSEAGSFNNRFILRYTADTLSTNESESSNGLSIMAPGGKHIKITSTISPIHDVTLYDLLGRVVMDTKDVNNSTELIIETKHLSDGSYISKVRLVDGTEKTQKVVLKQ